MSNIRINSIDVNRTKEETPPPSYTDLNPLTFNHQIQGQWIPNNPSHTHVAFRVIDPQMDSIENYKIWSITNTLCCCLCLGLFACHYSYETDALKLRGDIQGALKASKNARILNITATLIGTVIIFLYILTHIYLSYALIQTKT